MRGKFSPPPPLGGGGLLGISSDGFDFSSHSIIPVA